MLDRGRTPNGVVGVKQLPLRLDELAGQDWISDLGEPTFIYLVRRDRLERALSDVKAQQTRQYRASSRAQGQPQYNQAMIRRALTTQPIDEGRAQPYFALNGIVPLEVVYEDLVEDAQTVVDRVAAFVGIGERVFVDGAKIGLTVQRDATNDDWRRRFVAEHRRLSCMPTLAVGRGGRLIQRISNLIGWTA